MPVWTEDQLRVIHSGAKEILCAAAAGSGKTAVLVERIVRLISEGADPEEFLVVTFTNAAAAEMKEKIRNRLLADRKKPEIRNALDKIEYMQVSTIHSFCQKLIRDQFQFLELDPFFQICDTSQRKQLFHEAFRDACEQLQNEQDQDYIFYKKMFTVQKAEETTEEIYRYIMSLAHPYDWLEKAVRSVPVNMDPDHPWFRTVILMVQEKLNQAEMILNRLYKMLQEEYVPDGYRETWKADCELFHVKQRYIESPGEKAEKASFTELPRKRLSGEEAEWRDRYKPEREAFRKLIGETDDLLLADPDKIKKEFRTVRDELRGLGKLTAYTGKIFRDKKRQKNLVDFTDLEHEAVCVLTDDKCRESLQKTYRYIFVDECQDVSAVQDEIIRLLHSSDNSLFMVGDVKQSIYRFRLADPTLFLERIREYTASASDNRECIYLRANFRSRPEILQTTNTVFRSVMKENVTELDYTEREELVPGRITSGREPVFVDILSNDCDDGYSVLSATADHIASQIEILRGEEKESGKKYQYRDCVILMPAVKGDGQRLAELLRLRNVPVFFDGDAEYYQMPEILSVRALLELIENPAMDISLMSVLREVPFCFTEKELSRIRLKLPDKNVPFCAAFTECSREESEFGKRCKAVLEKLHLWQSVSESMNLSDFLWYLYQETGLYYVCASETDGAARQANLRMLCDQAVKAEQRGILTVGDFLSYMQSQQVSGDQRSACLLGEKDDMVRIMTVHKSKGLQFPVVFCAGLNKAPFGKKAGNVSIHQKLGICVPFKDPDHRISRKTVADEIFSWQKMREERAEKIRLLYVAMTRAQERLFLIIPKQAEACWSLPDCDYRIVSATDYTDWIMPPLRDQDEKKSTGFSQAENPWKIRTFDCNQQRIVENSEVIHNLSPWLNSVISSGTVEEMWRKKQEEDSDDSVIKRSVTALIRNAREEIGEENPEETPESKRTPQMLAKRLERYEIQETPEFMQRKGQITGAQRGTLIHRLLSGIDLETLRKTESYQEAVAEEKQRMIREKILTAEEAAIIPESETARFFETDIGQRLLKADTVKREWNFNLYLKENRKMILQGVVDCAFRERDSWVVLDYKTDAVKSGTELAERYRPQLKWYGEALERLTGIPVSGLYLYSIPLGEAVRL